MRFILTTLIMAVLAFPGQTRAENGPKPDLVFKRAMNNYQDFIKSAETPVAEACRDRYKILFFLAARGDVHDRKNLANAITASLRADGCLKDRFFSIQFDNAKTEPKCSLPTGEEMPRLIPYNSHAVGVDVVVLKIGTFRWFDSASCANGNERIDEVVDRLKSELSAYKGRSLILDLRSNLGGYVEAVRQLLDHIFSPASDIVMFVSADRFGEEEIYTAHIGTWGCPAAVLINRNTASASEITTAVLREWCPDLAIIGEKSYGKGKTIIEMRGNSTIRFSDAEIYAGSESEPKKIDKVGIQPNTFGFYWGRSKFPARFSGVAYSALDNDLDLAVEVVQRPAFFLALRKLAQEKQEELGDGSQRVATTPSRLPCIAASTHGITDICK